MVRMCRMRLDVLLGVGHDEHRGHGGTSSDCWLCTTKGGMRMVLVLYYIFLYHNRHHHHIVKANKDGMISHFWGRIWQATKGLHVPVRCRIKPIMKRSKTQRQNKPCTLKSGSKSIFNPSTPTQSRFRLITLLSSTQGTSVQENVHQSSSVKGKVGQGESDVRQGNKKLVVAVHNRDNPNSVSNPKKEGE